MNMVEAFWNCTTFPKPKRLQLREKLRLCKRRTETRLQTIQMQNNPNARLLPSPL